MREAIPEANLAASFRSVGSDFHRPGGRKQRFDGKLRLP